LDCKPRKPWVAGVLTLVTRGLGHLYAGNPGRGIVLFVMEQLAYISFAFSAAAFTPDIYFLAVAILLNLGYTVFCVRDAVLIANLNKDTYLLKPYNRWYFYVGYLILLSLCISTPISAGLKANLIKAYKLPSGAMEPTLLIGDHVLIDRTKSGRLPKRGDIIVFEYPEDPTKDFIKRVVAVEKDTVEVRDKQLLVNGKEMIEPYIVHSEPETIPAAQNRRDYFGPQVVPPGCYFTMGDNRDRTYDSRFWGAVPKAKVRGVVKSIYWSWDKEKRAVRWDRIGVKIRNGMLSKYGS